MIFAKSVNRRYFLGTGFANLGLGALALQSCGSKPDEAAGEKQSAHPFTLEETDIRTLQSLMERGEMTSRTICEQYLSRINDIDKNGPALNSVIEINPDALAIADELDRERKSGKLRGALHGIPILIKDNIDTGDKMMTTAGSLALEGNIAAHDAFAIGKLRNAGAVILGKTNLSEWANFRDERSSSGWSSRGGQTRNPYVLDRNPCGSSSGSGTAVAASLCAAAVGTETNGSIACPSAINGLVGIKPTVGLVSRSGIIPISHTQDTAGPMTRTVADAAILLGALAGVDANDAITNESQASTLTDYTPALDPRGLQNKRIGFDKSVFGKHEEVDARIAAALDVLRKQGATIVDVDFLSKVKNMQGAPYAVLLYEFKDGVNKYLATAKARAKTLEDVIAFNNTHEERAMPYFKQSILLEANAKGGLDEKAYREALDTVRKTTRGALDHLLKDQGLDALCGPTNGPSWCTDHVNGDFYTGYGVYSAASQAGYPHITVPMGFVSGLPVGISLIGRPYGEAGLIAMAYAYEQATHFRQKPEFRPTLP